MRGELQLVQVVDEHVVGGLELLVAEIPLGRPRELPLAQRTALGHPGGPDIQTPPASQGFFMASATPLVNDLFTKWADALNEDQSTRELLAAAQVPIQTRDVVDANLLKTTIELIDYRSGAEESLDGALAALERVQDAATDEAARSRPARSMSSSEATRLAGPTRKRGPSRDLAAPPAARRAAG